jgi:thiosulfate/3-mercaptopyruvate sulfurtransferase
MKNKLLIALVVVAVLVAGFFGYRSVFGAKKVIVDSSAQGEKISEYANEDAFITPLQLRDLMDNSEDVVVIGSLNPTKGDTPIKGSFTMWRSDYSASEGAYDFGGMSNTDEEMTELLSSFGATKNSTIVVYAANSHHDAARLFWQIHYKLGHKDVRFLDGGLNAWLGAGYPVGDANPSVDKTEYKGNPTDENTATLEMVIEAVNNPDEWLIIDTRTADENSGASTKSGAYGPGMIPNSLFIEWKNANAEDTTLKTKAELMDIYKEAVESGKKVIVYCQSGVRSAHTMVVLKEALGVKDVYNYDGSWIEWSYEYYENNKAVTIENGE